MAHLSRRSLVVGVLALGALPSCARLADTRLNPKNWFKKSRGERVAIPEEILREQADPRARIEQVTTLVIEPVHGGAIIRATGLPPLQGFYNGELVKVELEGQDPSVLIYDFRIEGPFGEQRVSTPQSREVVVGLFLSHGELEGIRTIRVEGEMGARVLSR